MTGNIKHYGYDILLPLSPAFEAFEASSYVVSRAGNPYFSNIHNYNVTGRILIPKKDDLTL